MAQILVIDDDPDIRELVKLSLNWDGHEVWAAGDGMKGLEMVKDVNPDLVLLDIGMPDADGWEILETMREQGIVRETPVAMLTASDLDLPQMSRSGIEDTVWYFEKPFSRQELSRRVIELIDRMGEIQDLEDTIERSPKGGRTLSREFGSISRRQILHECFLRKLNRMEERTFERGSLNKIRNVKEKERDRIVHQERRRREILESAGLDHPVSSTFASELLA